MGFIERSKSIRMAAALVAAGSLGLATVASADELAPEAVIVGEEIAVVEAAACPDCPAGNTGMISLAVGIDFYDKYFFRGYTQQADGLQTQPWAEVAIQLVDNGDKPFGDVSLFIGTWNSLNSRHHGFGDDPATTGPRNWYESDFYAGVGTSLGWGVSASVSYIAYMYPNNEGRAGEGDTIGEIDLAFEYDDSEYLGDFALSPYALFAFEIHNGTGTDSAGNSSEAGYFEFGVEPGYTVLGDTDYPISLSVPMSLGVSMYDMYYGDNDLGWAQLGGVVSVPLSFIPSSYGSWSVAAGVYGIWQSAAIRTGTAWQPNFGAGLSFDY